jgi:hypothetical protein
MHLQPEDPLPRQQTAVETSSLSLRLYYVSSIRAAVFGFRQRKLF